MREHRYRVWDGKRMSLNGISFHNTSGFLQVPVGSELMQFTGLLDKNGKMIFEGDIISVDDKTSHPVVWKEDFGGWDFGGRNMGYPKEWEIIGNIKEHPNLLNNKEEL